MSETLEALCARLVAAGEITDADVLAVRRLVWPDGVLLPAETDAIFTLNSRCARRSGDWHDFFVEALSHYVVRQRAPIGYVNDENAQWLISRIDADGKVDGPTELELLVRVMEIAVGVPDSLRRYGLQQIERAVMMGEGPTRLASSHRPGAIDSTEVTLLRRMLFAGGGEGASIISRDEAELLFRVKDATLEAANAPEWERFFVQCVGNHLMAHSDYVALSQQDAQRLEAFVQDTRVSVGTFFQKIFSIDGAAPVRKIFGRKGLNEMQAFDQRVAESRQINASEVAWLKEKLLKDDRLDSMERALLAFMIDESGPLPAELAQLAG